MQGEIQTTYRSQSGAALMHEPSIMGYELLQVLGEGAYGTVYLAKQQSTGQLVALKLLKLDHAPDELNSERQVKRFEKETRLCAGLHHPNIVRLLDKGQLSGKKIFAVFEYIPGETLKTYLRREGALPAPQAGELMAQLLDAIAAAHRVGIIHRDLKPSNIMVTQTGSCQHLKILDYGIGTFISNFEQVDDKTLTLTHEAVGTPSYSSPEQLRGEAATVKSDIYAWGLLVLECLTGQAVMQGSSLAEVFHKQLSPQDVQLPLAIVGHELGDLLRRVLQKNPQQRAGQAETLYQAFTAINFNEIVGRIEPAHEHSNAGVISQTATSEIDSAMLALNADRRNITVLACRIHLYNLSDKTSDAETADSLLANELSCCSDIALRYGGYQAGMLGDTLLFYYGYPYISDTDTRRAARTALELLASVNRRNELLRQRSSIEFALQFGLHSGMVVCKHGQTPNGITANTALLLMQNANPGHILASEPIMQVLQQYANFEQADTFVYPGSRQAQTSFNLLEEKRSEACAFDVSAYPGDRIVGRLAELKVLKSSWQKAKKGSGGAVLVQGDAGIGKSCLCYALQNDVVDSDAGVFEVRCLPEQQNRALFPLLELFRRHFGINNSETDFQNGLKLESALKHIDMPLEVTMPVACAWFALTLPEQYSISQLDPKEQKTIMLTIAEKVILGFTATQTCLLIIEDLHWADPTTIECLQKISGSASSSPLLLMLSARPQFAKPADWLMSNTIVLKPLSNQEMEKLIAGALVGRPIHSEALSKILDRAGGVPLFIQELMRMLLDHEILVFNNGIYTLGAGIDFQKIPITLLDLLNERLSAAGLDKEIAQLASVIGRESQGSLLAEVIGCNETDVQMRLDSLIDAGLLYKQRRVGGVRYFFRHMLIRDAAYESIPVQARSKIHYRIAQVIEATSPQEQEPDFVLLAGHWSNAKVSDKAMECYIKAGQRSASLYAYHEARHSFQSAILQADGLVDEQRSAKIELLYRQALESFADASIVLAEHEQGRKVLYTCLQGINDKVRDVVLVARLYRKIGKSWDTHHYHEKALDCYQSAVESLLSQKKGSNSEQWLQEWLEVSKAQLYVHYWRNDVNAMEQVIKQVEPTVQEHATPLQQAGFLDDVLHLLLRQSRFQLDEAGVEVAYKAQKAAKASEDFTVLSWAQFMLGLALLFNNDLCEAEKEMQAAVTMATKRNDITFLARCLTYLSIILRRQHKMAETLKCCKQALEVSKQAGMHDYIASAKANMAWHAWRENDRSMAEKLAREAEAIWAKLADSYPYPMQWLGAIVLAVINLQQGNLHEVARYAGKIIADDQTKLNEHFSEKLADAVVQTEVYKHAAKPAKLKRHSEITFNSAFEQAMTLGYL